jgi:hypothetical protein
MLDRLTVSGCAVVCCSETRTESNAMAWEERPAPAGVPRRESEAMAPFNDQPRVDIAAYHPTTRQAVMHIARSSQLACRAALGLRLTKCDGGAIVGTGTLGGNSAWLPRRGTRGGDAEVENVWDSTDSVSGLRTRSGRRQPGQETAASRMAAESENLVPQCGQTPLRFMAVDASSESEPFSNIRRQSLQVPLDVAGLQRCNLGTRFRHGHLSDAYFFLS